jgi:branched-chain amino acid transport system substrate-binding protein
MKFGKIVSTIAVASMLVACSGGTSTTSSGTELQEGDTIKIGFIGPLTGSVSSYGIPVGNTIELAVEDYNNNPDSKYKVELLKEDTGGAQDQATSAYKKLVGEGVVGIVGPVITAEGLAVGEASKSDQTPIVSSSTTGDTITLYDDGTTKTNYFRTCSNDSMGGTTIAKAISSGTIKASKVAILTNSDSDYSQGGTDSFKTQAEADGTTIVLEDKYPETTADFGSYADKVIASGADAVFIPDYYETIAKIVSKFKEKGFTGTFLGTDGWDGVLSVKNVDGTIFDGSYYLTPYDDRADGVVEYVKAYKEKFGSDTNTFGTMAYDATNILLQAIETAGTTDAAAINDALSKTNYDGITGHFEFDEKNTPTKDLFVKTIKDGQYAYID